MHVPRLCLKTSESFGYVGLQILDSCRVFLSRRKDQSRFSVIVSGIHIDAVLQRYLNHIVISINHSVFQRI